MKHNLILAIETSCDETSVSILEAESSPVTLERYRLRAHIVESQIAIHRPFGGVVPEVAARDHLTHLPQLIRQACDDADIHYDQLTAVVTTLGPGLIGALMVGVLCARGLATSLEIPLWGVNHVDAHLAPAILCPPTWKKTRDEVGQWHTVPEITYPALALTVSGGHTMLSYLQSANVRRVLGHSVDDACGEAFDKVAKVLGLEYPGGPHIERLAADVSEPESVPFHYVVPFQFKDKKLAFSYSGLKTGVLYDRQKHEPLHDNVKKQLAYAFQEAAFEQLMDRCKNALQVYPEVKSLLVAGGVAANQRLRSKLNALGLSVHYAPLDLCSDNATMIAMHALMSHTDAMKEQPFARYTYAV